jgi:AmmeMemoRadiSam system protein B
MVAIQSESEVALGLDTSVRAPAVAGTFYPGSAQTLSRTVDDLLVGADVGQRSQCCGIIAPHAGYAFSGPIAAAAFASVRGLRGRIARAAILGPAHFVPFRGIAAPSDTAFATPLGQVPVDVAALEALGADALVSIDDEPHAPEHAIEVELPFLQAIFGSLPIVPLLFGSTSTAAVAAVIARIWTDDTLLVVSTDLSHFEDDGSARRHDERTALAIEAFDETAIGSSDACGHLALRGALIEASRRGLAVERLALRNSADATGDRRSVVGYGAWAFHAHGDAVA